MCAPIEIGRLPGCSVIGSDADGSIFDAAGERVWRLCRPGLQIDERFDDGTNLPAGVQRAIKAGTIGLAIAHQRHDITGLGIQHHHRRLQTIAA